MPFELNRDAVIAIGRGRIQGLPLDELLPRVEAPITRFQIFGVIAKARAVKVSEELGVIVKFWPRKISGLDLVVMRAQSGIALYERLVHLDEHSPSALTISWRHFDVSAACTMDTHFDGV